MKICIVTAHLLDFFENEDLASAATNLAELLSQKHDVEILFVENPSEESDSKYKSSRKRYQKAGVTIFGLKYPHFELHTPFLCLVRSFLVYFTLKNKSYDLIIFHDLEGLAYYSMLAKSLHLAFDKTKMTFNFFGFSEWRNLHNQIPIDHFSAIARDFIERESYRMADHLFFPTKIAKISAEESNLNLKHRIQSNTLLFPYSSKVKFKSQTKKNKRFAEICFFGKIETRSGIEYFLAAVDQLVHSEEIENVKITILGYPGSVGTIQSKEYLNQWSQQFNIPLNIIDDFENDHALSYLKSTKALAVLPYIDDMAGTNLVSCIENDIPFVCSNIPAFEEIIEVFNLKNFFTFQSKSKNDLAVQIRAVLRQKNQPAELDSEVANGHALNALNHRKKWFKAIENLSSKKLKRQNTGLEKISVCIIFFDRPEYLVQCLNSLSPVRTIFDEILIYINSDDKDQSRKTIEKIKTIPKVRCIYGKQKVSPGFAQNILTHEARNECLLFLDDDNILNFNVFKRLWKSVGKDWDIICCTLKKFHSSELAEVDDAVSHSGLLGKLEKVSYAEWLPVGANIALSLFHNHIGDNNFLIRKSHLLKIGGVNEKMFYNEDAELIIRSIYNDGRYYLSPESFIFYRKHTQNLSSEDKDYISKDIKAMRPLLQAINSDHLLPVMLMSKNLSHKMNKNPDGHSLGQIELASKYLKSKSEMNIQVARKMQKIFKNEIRYNSKKRIMICNSIKPKKNQNTKNVFPDKTLHFIFYNKSDLDILVNDSPFKLNKGYNAITITFDQRRGIHIYSKGVSIDFVEVKRASFDYRL